ncbi:NUDIX domain-containing protein [Halobacillus trueperi]|uniref:NUDIX domain-containing protein n=1 Tax=Halobacillus trueperi TaxID=156205 RepID=A0A3D8VTR0_9BACI|nr:NUDIX domain-containing protein [Halobacillus trueperi]RDY72625.1 NUDIX domain-containing protein [Halobacillus trueperi]
MYPRAKSLGLVIHKDLLLLEHYEGKHSNGEGNYYRPLGGTIEFGERSYMTVNREFKEEIGTEVLNQRYITCLENIYEINGKVGHEIFQIYLVDLKEEWMYDKPYLKVKEGERSSKAYWVPIKKLIYGDEFIYPEGLTQIIRKEVLS